MGHLKEISMKLAPVILSALMITGSGCGKAEEGETFDASIHDTLAKINLEIECIRGDSWTLRGTHEQGRVEFDVVDPAEHQLLFTLFKRVSLAPSFDAELSDEHASLVFSEIVVLLKEKNEMVKVRSLLSESEGWVHRALLTSNAHCIEYLRQENLFPAYLVLPDKAQTFVSLTDVPVVDSDDEGIHRLNWRKKGFSLFISEDRIDAFENSEISDAFENMQSDVLYVYDGKQFQDIAAEAERFGSGDLLETIAQRLKKMAYDIWFVRVNGKAIHRSPVTSRSRDEEPIKDVYLGDPMEILFWETREQVMVRCVSSGSEGWILRYYLTPNEFEIDHIQASNLSPETGMIRQSQSEIVLGGTIMTISDGNFMPVKENTGFMMVFDGAQDRQEKFCRDNNISFTPSAFACYVYDGKRFVEVLPVALNQFRQKGIQE